MPRVVFPHCLSGQTLFFFCHQGQLLCLAVPALVITLLYLYNSIRKSRPFARSVSEAKAFLVNPGHTSCPPPTPPPPRGPRTSAVQPGHAQFPTEARRARQAPITRVPPEKTGFTIRPLAASRVQNPSSTWPPPSSSSSPPHSTVAPHCSPPRQWRTRRAAAATATENSSGSGKTKLLPRPRAVAPAPAVSGHPRELSELR